MSSEQFTNLAITTLASNITTTGATSVVVSSATNFPTQPQFRILIDSELMLVTAVSGTTFTITLDGRGIEGTTAATHTAGVPVAEVVTVKSLGLAIVQQPDNFISTAAISYPAAIYDRWIEVTSSGATVTLPTASGQSGKSYGIINASNGNITIACFAAETINGYSTVTLTTTETLTIVSNGSIWRIT